MVNVRSKRKGRKGIREGTQRTPFCVLCEYLCVPLRLKLFIKSRSTFVLMLILAIGVVAQTRRRQPIAKPVTQQAPKGSPTKYFDFKHSSVKHKSMACNDFHNSTTTWTSKLHFYYVAVLS